MVWEPSHFVDNSRHKANRYVGKISLMIATLTIFHVDMNTINSDGNRSIFPGSINHTKWQNILWFFLSAKRKRSGNQHATNYYSSSIILKTTELLSRLTHASACKRALFQTFDSTIFKIKTLKNKIQLFSCSF